MFQRLIKQTKFDIEERTYSACYYETRKIDWASRYSAEVVFRQRDHMVLDAASVKGLEIKLASLVHASCYGRMLVDAATLM